jgi:hypothetical protein
VSKHEEFPELTEDAIAAFQAGCNAAPLRATVSDLWGVGMRPMTPDRRYLAGFLREAMKRADPLGIPSPTLEAIANNLHSPPPPPPTLAQAREADLDTPEGMDVVRAFLATLGEGQQP